LLADFNEYDNSAFKADLVHEYVEWDSDVHEKTPDLGSNWERDAYATAKEQSGSDAFVEFDDVFNLVGHGSRKNEHCGECFKPKTKHLIGCLNAHGHNGFVDLNGKDYSGLVFIQRVFHSCGRSECPSCALKWAVKNAKRSTANLEYCTDKLGYDEIYHTIVSFPKD
jgi:hypothetical protein